MFKNSLLIGLISLTLVATPLMASADTVSDIRTQISNLEAQLQSLQVQLKAAITVGLPSSTASSTSGSIVASVCPNITRSLSIGSRGDDVAQLQHFLSVHGFLDASSTGYFGAMTKAAIGKWQSENSIATSGNAGFGIFGPLSRSHFGRLCNGDDQKGQGNKDKNDTDKQAFSADPKSGSAPLTVTFTTSDSITASSTYSVDFGDGQTADMAKGSCIAITAIVGGQGGIRCSYSVAHTYASNGTYTARLMKDTCPVGAQCLVGPMPVASKTITVDSSDASNIVKVNAPANVTLSTGGIAEVRNEHVYFTLQSVTATTATIQPTAVGCWNSFPSDPKPEIRCMIAVMPIAPSTLQIGQSYATANYAITLTGISTSTATFSVSALGTDT